MLTSSVGGAIDANPIIHQLRPIRWVSPSRPITQAVKREKPKVQSISKGRLTLVHGPEGTRPLAREVNVRDVNDAGGLDLTELGPDETQEDRRSDGVTPTSRNVNVVRDAPATVAGGSAALQIGVHPSHKFSAMSALVKVLTPEQTDHFAVWPQNWERLRHPPEDVAIG